MDIKDKFENIKNSWYDKFKVYEDQLKNKKNIDLKRKRPGWLRAFAFSAFYF